MIRERTPHDGRLQATYRALRAPGTHGRRVLSTGGALVVSQLLLAVAGIVAARALGPDGRGAVGAVLVWAQLLPFIAIAGLNTALTVRVAAAPDSDLGVALGNGLAYALAAGSIVALGAMAVLPAALARLGAHVDLITAAALATIPLSLLAEVVFAAILALDRLRRYNLCRVLGPALVLASTAVLWRLDALTPATVVASSLGGGIVATGVAALGLPWRASRLDRRAFLADARFGLQVALGGWLAMANFRLDMLVMSIVVSASQIGFYGVANNVMIPVATLAAAAAGLLTPAIARLGTAESGASDRVGLDQLQLILRETLRYGRLAVVGGLALAALTPWAVPLLFGHAFDPAVRLVWILIPGYIGRACANVLVAGTNGMRQARVGNIVEGASLVATAALLPVLLPRYDAVGAAVTSTIAYVIAGAIAFWLVHRLRRRAISAASASSDADTNTASPLASARGGSEEAATIR